MDFKLTFVFLLCVSTIEGSSCPAQDTDFPHGQVSCTDHSCEFSCTSSGYSVSPPDHAVITCTSNGTWSEERPCCARPCPPYYELDVVKLFHFSEQSRRSMALEIETNPNNTDNIADDAVMQAMIYYSSSPNISSQIKFNEYNANKTQLNQLVAERLESVNQETDDAMYLAKGKTLRRAGTIQSCPKLDCCKFIYEVFSLYSGNTSNLGAAIRYAMDNLLLPINGARDDEVTKAIFAYTDRNSDDDASTPAAEARQKGILIYIFAYQSPGYSLDAQQFEGITGKKDHVIIYGNDQYNLDQAEFDEHFCGHPCEHAEHDHD